MRSYLISEILHEKAPMKAARFKAMARIYGGYIFLPFLLSIINIYLLYNFRAINIHNFFYVAIIAAVSFAAPLLLFNWNIVVKENVILVSPYCGQYNYTELNITKFGSLLFYIATVVYVRYGICDKYINILVFIPSVCILVPIIIYIFFYRRPWNVIRIKDIIDDKVSSRGVVLDMKNGESVFLNLLEYVTWEEISKVCGVIYRDFRDS